MKFKKTLSGVMATGVLMTGACGENAPEIPKSNISVDEIISNVHPTLVKNGESKYIKVINPASLNGDLLLNKINLIEHIFSHGSSDKMAPKISENPIRTLSQVSLDGKGPELNNDGACDSYPVEGNPSYIGAIAIGGQESGAILVWPKDSKYADVCVFQDMEPADDAGIVLFSTNRQF